MEIQCPNCYDENAFYDGVCYVCNNCGYTWGGTSNKKKRRW